MANPGATVVQAAFSAGIDEGTRPELFALEGGFRTLENVRQWQRGAAGKRYGFTALSTSELDGTTLAAGYRLLPLGSAICQVGGTSSYDFRALTYSPTASRWVDLGDAPEAGYRIIDLPAYGQIGGVYDVEACNGYVAAVWSAAAPTSVYAVATVIDATTWQPVVAPVTVGSSGVPLAKIASYGTTFMLLIADSGAATIKAYSLDTSTAAGLAAGWQYAGIIASNYGGGLVFSIASLTSSIACAWTNTNAGTARVSVARFDSSGYIQGATLTTASTTIGAIDCAANPSDTLWVAWTEGANVRAQGLSPSDVTTTTSTVATVLTMTTGASPITVAADTTNAGYARIAAQETGTTFQTKLATFRASGGATTVTTSSTVQAIGIYGRMFYASTTRRFYMPVYGGDADNAQGSLVIADVSDFSSLYDVPTFARPVVNLGAGLGSATLSKTVAIGSKWYFGFTLKKSGVALAPELAEIDLRSTQTLQAVPHNKGVYLSGGVLSYCDGRRIAEAAFIIRPPVPTLNTASAGSLTLSNGRTYVAVYEETDADGNWHQSNISDPSASSGAVTSKIVKATVTPLTLSSRVQSNNVRVAFYATLDSADGEPPYYRLGTVANDTTASTLTYNDQTNDATLATQAVLYSPSLPGALGGALGREAPPGLMHVTSYNGMLVGAIGRTLRWSGQPVDGEGTWFSSIFQAPLDGAESDVTGIRAMDGSLYAFTRTEVFQVTGEAPSDNGASGGLGTPRRISADFGCIDARSLVVTPLGIFFQSLRGLELLNRGLAVEWVGEAVRATTTSYPVCTSATYDRAAGRVYFEMASAESSGQVTGTGRTLVYSLTLRLWESIDRRTSSGGTADTPAQSSAVVYTGSAWRYAWLATDGTVYTENGSGDASAHLDPGSRWIAKVAETADVKVGGLQGRQWVNRVLLLAKKATNHDASIAMAYDYASAFETARTWTAAEVASIASALPNLQVQSDSHDDAACQAVRVRITDATPSTGEAVGTGEGATWIGLAFEAKQEAGAYQLPDVAA